MQRIKSLNAFQKIVLLLLAAMILIFSILYPIIISRVGFAYRDAILLPGTEQDAVIYTGTIHGTPARFTVSADRTVLFQYGDRTYGPYTVRTDPTALPDEDARNPSMTGIELRSADTILFRGGVEDMGDFFLLTNEDGTPEGLTITAITSSGTEIDSNGNVLDPMEPSPSILLELMNGPALTHKGTWLGLFGGICFCILTAISMLFADDLFRLDLFFRVSNPAQSEPADFVIFGRYLSWIALPILALFLFILGLQ